MKNKTKKNLATTIMTGGILLIGLSLVNPKVYTKYLPESLANSAQEIPGKLYALGLGIGFPVAVFYKPKR